MYCCCWKQVFSECVKFYLFIYLGFHRERKISARGCMLFSAENMCDEWMVEKASEGQLGAGFGISERPQIHVSI